jgi:putative copper export protein
MPFFLVKVVHVGFAALWLGGAILNLVLLQPILGKATYASRREVLGRLSPAMNKYFGIVGGIAFLSGLALVGLHPNGWTNITQTAWGKTVLFALVLTLFALYLGAAAIRPTLNAIAKVQSQLKPEDEPPANLRFLITRLKVTSWMVAILLALVFAVMVYADQLSSGAGL